MGSPLSACMIQTFECPFSPCAMNEAVNFLLLGLDAAGTTTILYRLKFGEVVTPQITVGFNIAEITVGFTTVDYKNAEWCIRDMGGHRKQRQMWPHFYYNVNAVVFVVDSADTTRISEACEVLANTMSDFRLCQAVLLLLANKQDLEQAAAAEEVADKLSLFNMADRDWRIQGSCATSGEGLYDGFDWLYERLHTREQWHASTSLPSPVAIEQPSHAVVKKQTVVWDRPGGPHATCLGTLSRETGVEILEVLPASSQTVLTHGRIEEPIAGWISLQSGHVSAGPYVVTLHVSADDQGCNKCLCYNMAGDEVARLDLDYLQPQSLIELQQYIGKSMGKDAACLKLASPNGQLIQELDQLRSFPEASHPTQQ